VIKMHRNCRTAAATATILLLCLPILAVFISAVCPGSPISTSSKTATATAPRNASSAKQSVLPSSVRWFSFGEGRLNLRARGRHQALCLSSQDGGKGNPNLLMLSLAPRLLLLLRFTGVEAGEPDRSMSLSAMLAPVSSSLLRLDRRRARRGACVWVSAHWGMAATHTTYHREKSERPHTHSHIPLASTASTPTGVNCLLVRVHEHTNFFRRDVVSYKQHHPSMRTAIASLLAALALNQLQVGHRALACVISLT
jgi:hypothetical protein